MAPSARSIRARALHVLALLLAAAFAGCAARDEAAPRALVEALVDTRAMDWSRGNWWAYRASAGDVSVDVAMIVHGVEPDGFLLGSNSSAGFFGLPFAGEIDRDLNPRIGPDVWPLFDFPLEDGKEWGYTLFGYDARTVARATLVDVPGLDPVPGFALEASSFGRTFAHYDYVPEVGWFTRLHLIDPSNDQTALLAELTAFGPDWRSAYFVEETLHEIVVDYPALPDGVAIEVAPGHAQVRAFLSVEAATGLLAATLDDARGRTLAHAEVLGRGADAGRASARPEKATTWTLAHHGAAVGSVYLQITGLRATGPLAAPEGPAPSIDLPALLQSTRPALPHEGQVTSTGPLPLGV